jgi:Lon protease-like protein
MSFQRDLNDIAQLPEDLPIFPLPGVLLLPNGNLPLNIFEPRYVAMIDEAIKTHRMIGMIQPQESGGDLYKTGCAGRITSLTEADDGRYLITLGGLCRFTVAEELPLSEGGYRHIRPDWGNYSDDLKAGGRCLDLDRTKLRELLSHYFDMHDMSCDWDIIDEAQDNYLMTCLSMACPFNPQEKQALLEADNCAERAGMFMTMLEMAIRENRSTDCCGGCH